MDGHVRLHKVHPSASCLGHGSSIIWVEASILKILRVVFHLRSDDSIREVHRFLTLLDLFAQEVVQILKEIKSESN